MASASITMRNPRKRLCPFDSVQSNKKLRTEYYSSSDSHASMFSLLPDEIVVEVCVGFFFFFCWVPRSRQNIFFKDWYFYWTHREKSVFVRIKHKKKNPFPPDYLTFYSRFCASYLVPTICNRCLVFPVNSPIFTMNLPSGGTCVMSNFLGEVRTKPKSPPKKIGSHILFDYIECLYLQMIEKDSEMHFQHLES